MRDNAVIRKTVPGINAYYHSDLLMLIHGRRCTQLSRPRIINPDLPSKKYSEGRKRQALSFTLLALYEREQAEAA